MCWGVIIGLTAAAFVVYIVFVSAIMKRREQIQLAKFNETYSNSPLSEEQKRLLVFGAILSHNRFEKIFSVSPERKFDGYFAELKRKWGIYGRKDAKEALTNLLKLRKSTEFEPHLQYSSKELLKIQKKIASGLKLNLSVVEQTKSAYAWDICRAVSLAKQCFWCGYLNEEEVWEIMRTAAKVALVHGDSWTDYTVSFLLGYAMQGCNLRDVIYKSGKLLLCSDDKNEDMSVYKKYSFK